MHTLTRDTAEHHDPHCLTPEATADLLAGRWRRLAVIGDSIAAGLGDPVPGYDDRSWADQIAGAMGAGSEDFDHINLGVAGLTMSQIRYGQAEAAAEFGPDVAVVTGGGNDMLAVEFDPDGVAHHLDAVMEVLSRTAVVVTFGLMDLAATGLLPAELTGPLRQRLMELNEVTRAVCEDHGGIHVDFFAHPALDASLISSDAIHPNRRGHAVIAATVARALDRSGGQGFVHFAPGA